ncbi:MAG: S8 family serine peptidase [Clostridia bacterium]|nr:S8 family serine peptidase [Clostridia bacterium]
MEKYDCVIIDSGVDSSHPKLQTCKLEGMSFFLENGVVRIAKEDFKDKIGHGTAIFGIISSNCPKDTSIYNISIFNDSDSVDEELLYSALEYVYKNIKCKVVNISMGIKTCDQLERLNNICEKFNRKNVMLVSAFDNDGSMSYPACLENVIGIDASSEYYNITEFEYVHGREINFRAKGGIQKVLWTSPKYAIVQGSSFACAYMTSNILNVLERHPNYNKNDVIEYLKTRSKNTIESSDAVQENEVNNFFNPEKVLIFPFNKEMHSLVAFNDLCNFTISKICDIRMSSNINKRIGSLLQYSNDSIINDMIIENIDSVVWDETFDTVILGHVELLNQLTKRDITTEIIEKCKFYHKNLICMDDLSKYKEEINSLVQSNCKVYYLCNSTVGISNQFGKLYLTNRPVVCVAGTNRSQGKYTLQLLLRRHLLELGYSVGQLGTEPTSLLFGMDEVFHYGYSVINTSYFEQTVLRVNRLMKRISDKNPDIILTGVQSGTVPYIYDNLQYLTNRQFEVLMGIIPDIVVLCINPFDDVDYIERSIKALESMVNTRVIACVLYPMKFSDNFSTYSKKEKITNVEEFNLKTELYRALNIPIFSFGKDDVSELTELIINYFSS